MKQFPNQEISKRSDRETLISIRIDMTGVCQCGSLLFIKGKGNRWDGDINGSATLVDMVFEELDKHSE